MLRCGRSAPGVPEVSPILGVVSMGVLYLRTCLSRRVAFDVYERRDDNMAEGWTSFVGVTNRDLDLTSSVTIYSCHCKLTLN